MTIYWEFGNIIITLAAMIWGGWVGWMLRGDCNNEKLLGIQQQHIKEIFRTRKARLCELLELPVEGE